MFCKTCKKQISDIEKVVIEKYNLDTSMCCECRKREKPVLKRSHIYDRVNR